MTERVAELLFQPYPQLLDAMWAQVLASESDDSKKSDELSLEIAQQLKIVFDENEIPSQTRHRMTLALWGLVTDSYTDFVNRINKPVFDEPLDELTPAAFLEQQKSQNTEPKQGCSAADKQNEPSKTEGLKESNGTSSVETSEEAGNQNADISSAAPETTEDNKIPTLEEELKELTNKTDAATSDSDQFDTDIKRHLDKLEEECALADLETEEAAIRQIKRPMVTGLLRCFNSSTICNFYPLCRWNNGLPSKIENAKELYPEMANILLGDANRVGRKERLTLANGILLNIPFEDSELESTFFENKSKFTLDIYSLFAKKEVRNAAFDDRENGYWQAFYIVEPVDPESVSLDKKIEIKLDSLTYIRPELSDLARGQFVVLKLNNKYYGPLSLKEDALKRLYVAPLTSSENRGIVDCFEERPDAPVSPIFKVEGINVLVNLKMIFTNPLLVRKTTVDMVSDEALVKEFIRKIPRAKGTPEVISRWMLDNLNNGFFDSGSVITKQRALRLLKYLQLNLPESRQIEQIVEMISSAMSSAAKRKPELFEEIYKRVITDQDVLKSLPAHKLIMEDLKELEDKREDLQRQISELEHRKKDKEREAANKRRKSELEKEIELLESRLEDLKEIKDIRKARDDERGELVRIRKEVRLANEELAQVKKEREDFDTQLEGFNKKINETVRTVADLAFDGQVTAKIMAAANRWNDERNTEATRNRVNFLKQIKKSSLTGRALNDELIKRLSRFRKYDPNEFTNMFVCIAQNFLTVFSGTPGSGKTSMCNLIAVNLGLNSIAKEQEVPALWNEQRELANRYVPVSVEKGWTSKRDLIGYYNPLTRRFESQDLHRIECFRQLDAECGVGFQELPYFILLDEANLSPMEYYFADFMNICDVRDSFSYISLGNDMSFKIPDTLRFLATINNDHTTENLSPRLIDRAWIITLPDTDSVTEHSSSEMSEATDFEPINWQNFLATFGKTSSVNLSGSVTELLQTAKSMFNNLGVQVSPRTQFSMANFIQTSSALMKSGDGQSSELLSLDYAIAQKLLPTINGVGEGYKEQLNELQYWLSDTKLTKSAGILEQIISQGESRMDYFGYF